MGKAGTETRTRVKTAAGTEIGTGTRAKTDAGTETEAETRAKTGMGKEWRAGQIQDTGKKQKRGTGKGSEESPLTRGKKRAMRLLEQKDYARSELVLKLQRDGYEEEVVKEVLAYLDRFHYLDDVRLAGVYIRARKESKSRRELEFGLRQKGICEEDIAAAMEENYCQEDEEHPELLSIRRQLGKYRLSEEDMETMEYQEKQKVAAKLYRKGFSQENIRKALHF